MTSTDSSAASDAKRPFIGRARLAKQRPYPGVYEHFKGQRYEVLETALHCDTLQAFVVYRALYGDGSLWIRPRSEFLSKVDLNGKAVPRFRQILD